MKKENLQKNEIAFRLPALGENEAVCRAVVGAFVAGLNPTVEDLADIKCAVSEAVTNCIVHAYRGQAPGFVYIRVVCYRDGLVRITVRDTGCGIADIRKAMQPLFTTLPEEERSGMGFAVMENFTDRVRVRSVPGRGTTVTLEKKVAH